MFNKNNHVMKLVIISLLIALEILLTRIFCIQTPLLRISFGFFASCINSYVIWTVMGRGSLRIG